MNRKLDSIRKLYLAQEKLLGRELQRLRAERTQHEDQTQALHGLLAQYRAEHAAETSMSVEQARRFKRFYQKVADTLAAQDERSSRLSAAEDAQRQAWQGVYRQRLGIEKVIGKQVYSAGQTARRKERRASSRPADSGRWSRLNEDDGRGG